MSPEERKELDSYRKYIDDVKSKGFLKQSDWSQVTERSEFELYRSLIGKEALQEKIGGAKAGK